MGSAYEQLIEHFEKRGLKHTQHPETQAVVASFGGHAGSYRVLGRVGDDRQLFQVFGLTPFRVPEGSRAAIAETIARANYGLMLGKFELDLDDGELRFQVAHILTSDMLDDNVIERMIGVTLSMLDMYLPAFLSVIYGNELPRLAVRCVEAGRST